MIPEGLRNNFAPNQATIPMFGIFRTLGMRLRVCCETTPVKNREIGRKWRSIIEIKIESREIFHHGHMMTFGNPQLPEAFKRKFHILLGWDFRRCRARGYQEFISMTPEFFGTLGV